jgi:hypothetical protein
VTRNVGPDAQRADPHKVGLYVRFYANAVAAGLKAPQQHLHWIVSRCPYFQFQLQDAGGKAPKVSYTAMRRHDYDRACDHFTLESFLSDDPAIVGLFNNEVDHCRHALDPDTSRHPAKGFHTFVRDRLNALGLADRFDAALDTLMTASGFRFH